ncbi:MAG: hypothetical protein HDR48_02755 [Bacteroides sp.]|nr:hypothetical protein [Bacteroides sp.]
MLGYPAKGESEALARAALPRFPAKGSALKILMSFSRKRRNAGKRSFDHDYRARCIYHIVLNKNPYFPAFSRIGGSLTDRELPPTAILSCEGEIIKSSLLRLKEIFPFVSILRMCIMPDHLHFAIFIKERTEFHLGEIIRTFKTLCSEEYAKIGKGVNVKFFTEGYHDTYLWSKDQLQSMLHYISDNPRRHLIRSGKIGWFRQFQITDGKDIYEAYGNWDLLWEYDLQTVRFSRKYTKAQLISLKRRWLTTILNDGVLVSPFIHENEKKVRDWGMDNDASLIYLIHSGFGERYKPAGKLFDLCGEGRLLLVNIQPTEKDLNSEGKPSYSFCQKMNGIAERIAAGKFRLL